MLGMVLLTSTDPARQAEVFEAQKGVPPRGGGRQLYQQMPQKSWKKAPSLSVQQQPGASLERGEVQSTSPKGFWSALDFSASYIDLNRPKLHSFTMMRVSFEVLFTW